MNKLFEVKKVEVEMESLSYKKGIKDGVSIGLGYFAVSFGFGILAVKGGLGIFPTTLMSMVNLTSAGQFAGLEIILTNASLFALILGQVIINLRYALMSLALSQKLDENQGFFQRAIIAIFNTDEIFAVAMGQGQPLCMRYMIGLATLPWLGWSLGTLSGACAGEILPVQITMALSVALYAMFIAIVVPVAKTSKAVLLVVALSAGMSCLLSFIPSIQSFSIIICTVVSSTIVAWKFPIESEMED